MKNVNQVTFFVNLPFFPRTLKPLVEFARFVLLMCTLFAPILIFITTTVPSQDGLSTLLRVNLSHKRLFFKCTFVCWFHTFDTLISECCVYHPSSCWSSVSSHHSWLYLVNAISPLLAAARRKKTGKGQKKMCVPWRLWNELSRHLIIEKWRKMEENI